MSKKLIFFVAADPAVDPDPLTTAYFFASVAVGAKLNAEVRLAAAAVRAADPGHLGASDTTADVRRLLEKGPADGVFLSICPRGMEQFGVTLEQVRAIGAQPRPLAEILTEVADDRSALIPITHRIS